MKSLAFAMLWGVFVASSFAQPRLAATSAVAIGRFPETPTWARSTGCGFCDRSLVGAGSAVLRVIGPYGNALPDLIHTGSFTLIRWRSRETSPKTGAHVMFVWPSA